MIAAEYIDMEPDGKWSLCSRGPQDQLLATRNKQTPTSVDNNNSASSDNDDNYADERINSGETRLAVNLHVGS